MIPLALSPSTLPVHQKSSSDQEVVKLEPCLSLLPHAPLTATAAAPTVMPGNVCEIGRKRVRFADDCSNGEVIVGSITVSPKLASLRSPVVKRRRRCPVWHDSEEQVSQLEVTSARANDSPTMPLQSINYNLDVCGKSHMTSASTEDDQQTVFSASLPADPRDWTRSDVHTWLRQATRSAVSSRHQQTIDVDVERFRMNGKALCLMTSEMFAYRVPLGGHLLYKDFQARLCRAVAVSLHRSCTVDEQ